MSKTNCSCCNRRLMATKTLAYCALLTALSVVLARLFSLMPNESSRYSIEAVPIFIAGMLFGPMAGGMVGFAADFVGCLFSAFGYNPIFCVPPILYGVFGGIFRRYLGKKLNIPRLVAAFLPPVVLGSVLYQSCTLSYMYYDGVFLKGLVYYLSTRSVQFAIVLVLDVLLVFLLFRSGIFERLKLWPPVKKKDAEITTAEQAVAYIHSVCWKGSIPGLGRTNTLLEKMGNPHKQLRYVHIAGTNGKGSTAAMTASILQKAGYRTGLYTSPYIYQFGERMQVDGNMISDEELVAITRFVKPLADSMEETPTEFELVSCIAFEFFKRKGCDIVVLEVGMGGLLDSTNVIPCPEVAVITNIGLDHTDVLGNTLEEIALNKAGIIKENGHAVVYRGVPSVEAVFEKVCAEKNTKLKKADFDGLNLKSHDLFEQVFDCGEYKDLHLPLLGDHQLHNAAVVLSIVESLIDKGWKISRENIYDGIRDVSWPGRFDVITRDPLFIIDGGHNPQCLEALVKNIQDYLAGRRVIALTGVLADKDYGDMYKPVMPYIEQFVCVTPPNPRRLPAAELAQHLTEAGAVATACEDIPTGVRKAMELAGSDGAVLCFGSLYTIGDIKSAVTDNL